MEPPNERVRMSQLTFRNSDNKPGISMKRWRQFLRFDKERSGQPATQFDQASNPQQHRSGYSVPESNSLPPAGYTYYPENRPPTLALSSQALRPFSIGSVPGFVKTQFGGPVTTTEYIRPRQEPKPGEDRRSFAVQPRPPRRSPESARERRRPRSAQSELQGMRSWLPDPDRETVWLDGQLQQVYQQYDELYRSHEEAKAIHAGSISQMGANHAAELSDLREDHKTRQQVWKQERSQLVQANKDKISALERDYKAELSRRDQQHTARIQDSLARKDKEYASQISVLKDRLSRIDREHTARLQESLSRKDREHATRVSGLADKLSRIDREHATEMSSLRGSHNDELARLQTQYAIGLSQAEARHEDELSALSKKHGDQIMRLEQERDHAQQMVDEVAAQKNSEIERLMLRMASYSTNSYRAIPDKDFAGFYNSLSMKISKLASSWSRIQDIDPALDPHGFVKRNGSKGLNCRRFVGHICWSFLLREFFRYPLGFGAFGDQGEGYECLKDDYKLFNRAAGNSGTQNHGTDLEANNARAWRFNAILKAVSSPVPPDGARSRWADLFQENIDRVVQELSEVLRALGGASSSQGDALISGMAEDAGLLALRIGSQRAHLLLETCVFGDQAGTLQGFTSESERTNGEALVDLMLQPCLKRVGDGHEDLNKQKVLVTGKYLPQK